MLLYSYIHKKYIEVIYLERNISTNFSPFPKILFKILNHLFPIWENPLQLFCVCVSWEWSGHPHPLYPLLSLSKEREAKCVWCRHMNTNNSGHIDGRGVGMSNQIQIHPGTKERYPIVVTSLFISNLSFIITFVL